MIEYKQKAKFTRGNKKPTDYPILMVWDGRPADSLSLNSQGRRQQKTWFTGMEERDEEKGMPYLLLIDDKWLLLLS